SMPVAVNNEHFRWQLSLFWFAHQRCYGEHAAAAKAHAIVIERNEPSHDKVERMRWPECASIPHSICESFFDRGLMKYERLAVPLNIQCGLVQVLDAFEDDQLIEVIDCDMLHFRPHPRIEVGPDELLVSDVYEQWHLRSLTENRYVIDSYFRNEG